jgi:MFS family permease
MVHFLPGVRNVAVLIPDTLTQEKDFKHNFVVNILDGGFFGFGMGFGSLGTVLPLFISMMTDSAILIGLIPAIHVMGWQLPQLFTARHVAKQKRQKPMVMFRTIQERLPFLGLAVIAWFLPKIGPQVALGLSFGMLVWQGLGGGFTATAWQSMVGKIIPGDRWGLFFGFQSAAASLFASVSAVLAGIILERVESPVNYTICFLLTTAAMAVSWVFLNQTREEESTIIRVEDTPAGYWQSLIAIIRRDRNFRWFVAARTLAQLGTMGFSFYVVYAVRSYGIGEGTAGLLTAVLTIVQTIFNPIMGWFGDRWSHRGVMGVGILAAIVSSTIAWISPGVGWFYLVFGLAGVANVAVWTIAMAMTLKFGTESERPAYIGLANTLIAPTAFLIPLFGGWLADSAGYQATFIASVVGGLSTICILIFFLRDQRNNSDGIIPKQSS